jgi:uncharacterized protein DUF5681
MATKKSTRQPVGYGRPPLATRFRKGHSGNPKGRPKGARNRIGCHVDLDSLVRIMNRRTTLAATRIKAAKTILDIVAGPAFVDDFEDLD